ncbi:MAG TPA: PadR family transcriptional regulator [Cyclobacteriaceae bacterium]|jgi:DNA-binding PadR family transcriptional regulator
MHSSELLKGNLQTIILKVLSDQKRMYGYEIVQKVKQSSIETIVLTEGSLYPMLHKMEADGLLKIELEYVGKRIRKYYSLTETGASQVEIKLKEFAAFVKTMSAVLQLKLT